MLLLTMRASEVLADVFTYNAAISACEKGWQWERARELFRAMPACGVQADVITYSAAISACEKGGQGERALELSQAGRASGVQATPPPTLLLSAPP